MMEFSRGPEFALTVIFADDTHLDKLVWVWAGDKPITDTSFISDYLQTAGGGQDSSVGNFQWYFRRVQEYQVRFYFYTGL